MSTYLSNLDVRPTGMEPGEFLDVPSVNDGRYERPDHHSRRREAPICTGRQTPSSLDVEDMEDALR
jgi:hypothetical protein